MVSQSCFASNFVQQCTRSQFRFHKREENEKATLMDGFHINYYSCVQIKCLRRCRIDFCFKVTKGGYSIGFDYY